jgi:hypothetical protein
MSKTIIISESQYKRLGEALSIGGIEIFARNGKLSTNKGEEYEMCTPKGFMCVDLEVEDIFQSGSDYKIKLDTPIGKKEGNIPLEKLKHIVSQIGKDEIEVEAKTPGGDLVTVRLKKI